MKKACVFLMIAVWLLTAAPVSAEEVNDRTLIDIAQNMAGRIAGLYSEKEVINLFTPEGDVADQILSMASAWKQSGADHRAAVIMIPQASLDQYLAPAFSALNAPDAYSQLVPRFLLSAASYLNAGAGMTWMAAASVMALDDVCVLEGCEPGYAFVLLDSGAEGGPQALAAFWIKEDGAALIRTAFVNNLQTVFDLSEREFASLLNGLLSEAGPEASLLGADTLFGIRFTVYE